MAKDSNTWITVAAVGAGIYFAWPWLHAHLFGGVSATPAPAPAPAGGMPGGTCPTGQLLRPSPGGGPGECYTPSCAPGYQMGTTVDGFPGCVLIAPAKQTNPVTFTPAPTPPATKPPATPPAPQTCSFICPDGSTLTFDASAVGGCDKLVGLSADQLAALLGPNAPACPKSAPAAPPASPPPGSPTSLVTAVALALANAANQNSTPGPLTVWGWNYLYNTINPNTYWGSLGTGDADLPQYADGSLIDALTYATARQAAGYGLSGYSPSSRNGWLYSRRGASRTNYVRVRRYA